MRREGVTSLRTPQPLKRYKKSQQPLDMASEMEVSSDVNEDLLENSSNIDSKSIVELSKRVKDLKVEKDKDVSSLKEEMERKIQQQINSCKEMWEEKLVKEVEEATKPYEEELRTVKEELAKQQQKSELMSNVLKYNYAIFQDLTKRLDTVELNQAKKSAVLTGLSFSDKKKDLIRELKDLLQDELGVFVGIEDAYKLGNTATSVCPVVVVFETASDKHKVFAVKSRLDNIQGAGDFKVYLSDYMPAGMNEKGGEKKISSGTIKKMQSPKWKW